MSDKNNEFTYDEISYPSFVHAQTHPQNLAIMAAFYGMHPKNVESCRVLEIGCGNGSNLIAFANDLPQAEFIGIDLSEKQIAHGDSIAKELQLDNVKLIHASVLDMNLAEVGEFDYIIAHGFYSWTPEAVRKRALEICEKCLAEQGVAFVSYNVFPGGHMRELSRNAMLFHSRNEQTPNRKIEKSLEFLSLLEKSLDSNSVYGKILKHEAKSVSESSPNVIFHDDLEEVNDSFYFHEFAAEAKEHNLQFISEIDYFGTKDAHHTQEVREVLQSFGEDRITREQYLDFFVNRRFRQTLFCHKKVDLNHEPDAVMLQNLHVEADINPVAERCDLALGKNEGFRTGKDSKFQIDHPLTKAALLCLSKKPSKLVSYKELLGKSKELLNKDLGSEFEVHAQDEQVLAEVFMQLFGVGVVKFGLRKHKYAMTLSERPTAGKLVRWQIVNDFDELLNLRFESVKLGESFLHNILALLDGTRTRSELLDEIKTSDISNFSESVSEVQLDESLHKILNMALLVE